MAQTFQQLDAKYNIKRFVEMWLKDYDRGIGYGVLEHLFEYVVNSEANGQEEVKELDWGDLEYGKDT